MGVSFSLNCRRSGARILARVLLLAALCLPSLEAAAKVDTVYFYKENGTRVYTGKKPAHRGYTVLQFGRPTATASCAGLTDKAMQQRADSLDALVTRHAQAQRVPARLVRAVMRVESCFDQRAVSRVGARGLMQLMPATASLLGVRNSFDADQNIAGGARYLRMMLDRFNNNTRLALAAYNAGPGAVEKHRGVPPFPETQSYVQRVLAAYKKA